MLIYTVKKGDTLFELAERFRVTTELLASVNGLENPDRLSVGQALIIPKPSDVHSVQEGETLDQIARIERISFSQLYRNNPQLIDNPRIQVGDTLVIRYEGEHKRKLAVNGYAYPFIEEAALDAALPFLSGLVPFSYGFSSEGDLVTLSDDFLLEKAKDSGVEPIMLLTTLNSDGRFNNSLSHQLLEDEDLEGYLIQNILSVMMLKGYRCLNVDFEFLFSEDQLPYVAFLEKLKKAFLPYRYTLWVSLAPKTSRDQKGLLYEGLDYRKIGEIADRVLLMTFEWGYRYGEPYAVAPLNEIRRVVEYAVSEIDPEKILLGIPNYGYDHAFTQETHNNQNDGTSVISNREALDLALYKHAEIQFDSVAMSPYFRYFENGIEHRVCFEDARSLQAKLDLVDAKKLAGINFWTVMHRFCQGYFLLNSYEIE